MRIIYDHHICLQGSAWRCAWAWPEFLGQCARSRFEQIQLCVSSSDNLTASHVTHRSSSTAPLWTHKPNLCLSVRSRTWSWIHKGCALLSLPNCTAAQIPMYSWGCVFCSHRQFWWAWASTSKLSSIRLWDGPWPDCAGAGYQRVGRFLSLSQSSWSSEQRKKLNENCVSSIPLRYIRASPLHGAGEKHCKNWCLLHMAITPLYRKAFLRWTLVKHIGKMQVMLTKPAYLHESRFWA